MATATVTISTIGTQVANTPFAVTGTYTLSPATWTDTLSYTDDNGNSLPITSPSVILNTSSFSFVHPGLSAGTHTVTIKDPNTGTVTQSNVFTVTAAQTIVPNTPTGLTPGSTFAFTGTLTGFATAPALTYKIDGGAAVAMTGVTSTGFNMTLTAPSTAGAHTIQVLSGSLTSAVVSFTVTAVNKSITPIIPSGLIAGSVFNFTGTLTGYAIAPALTYRLDGLTTSVVITGVTTTGWSMSVTAPAAGSHTMVVTDGTLTSTVTFTVAATAKVIIAYSPPTTVAGAAFTFTGVLDNYTTIPSLTYSIDGLGPVQMTGISVTGWAMSVVAPAAGSHTIVVTDGTFTSGVAPFTTTAVATTTIPYYLFPGATGNYWKTPFGSGCIWGSPSDADTIDLRHGGYLNIAGDSNADGNYGFPVFLNLLSNSAGASYPLVSFSGKMQNIYSTAASNVGNSGTPTTATSRLVPGSYSAGPGPARTDQPYSYVDEYTTPGLMWQWAPVVIMNLQAGAGPYTGLTVSWEDATSLNFAEDQETGHCGDLGFAGLIRGADLDPAQNPVLIPGSTLTRINHALRFSHGPNHIKSNVNGNLGNSSPPNSTLLPNSWPNLYEDYQGGGTPSNLYTGNYVYGTSVGIPFGTALPSALAGNNAGIQLWDCLQCFPALIRDAGGDGTFYADQNVSQTWINQALAALPTIMQYLLPLRNQHLGGTTRIGATDINGPGTRVCALPPPLAAIGSTPTTGTTTGSVTPVTWNASDKTSTIALSGNNYVATTGGTSGAGTAPQGVRATIALTAVKIVAWEVGMTALTQDWAVGVANTTFNLAGGGGLGADANGIGAYPATGTGSQAPQTVYYNNALLSSGNGTSDTAGDVMSIVVNGTNFFFSTPAMRATAGVSWNNSTTANPATNIGGFPFAGMSAPYYPVFSDVESGGVAALNDGTSAFSSFLTQFLAANTSIVTLSGQSGTTTTTTGGGTTVATTTIAPNTPTGVVVNTPCTFSGALTGYRAAPILTYSINGATPLLLTGVTAAAWNMSLTVTVAGSTSIVVTDGTSKGTATFTVATAAGVTSNRIVAPLTGTVSPLTFNAANYLTLNGMAYILLKPANYDSTKIYPLVVFEHPDDQGTAYYTGGVSNDYIGPNYITPYFNTTWWLANYPCFFAAPLLNQSAQTSDGEINFGGYGNSLAGHASVLAIVNSLMVTYPIDPARVYTLGASMGATGANVNMLLDNTINGSEGTKLFAAGLAMSGVDYDAVTSNGSNYVVNASVVTQMQAGVPLGAIHGASDTDQPSPRFSLPLFNQLGGVGGNANGMPWTRAGTSNFYLFIDANLGHDTWDTYLGQAGAPYLTWLFSQISNSATAAVNITGVTLSATSATANSAVGTIIATLTATASGGSLSSPSFTLATTSTAFKIVGNSLEFASATVAAGSYAISIAVAATNAANTPQTYNFNITITAAAGSGTTYTLTPAGLVSYLKSIAGKYTISGQFIERGPLTPITNIHSSTGYWLGLIGGDYWYFNAPVSAGADTSFNTYAIPYWQAGGLITISLSMPNPTSGGGIQDGAYTNFNDLVTSGTATNTTFLSLLSQVATGLKALQNAGVVVLLRMFHEADGNWFWYGTQNSTDAQFVAMWKLAHDYFTKTVGLTNLVFVYAANAGYAIPGRFAGAAYVDVVGQDLYTSSPTQGQSTYSSLVSLGLPVAICEFGSGSAGGGDTSFQETSLVSAISSTMPNTVYWLQWWDGNAGAAGWGMAEVQAVQAALANPRVLNRGSISYFTGATTAPTTPTTPNPLVIMPLGDSVTAGGGTAVNGGPPPGSYRAPLYTLLSSAGYTVNYVGDQTSNPGGGLPSSENEHEGIGGITIEALQTYCQNNNILTTYKPNVICLFIGNNDMFQVNGLGAQNTYNLLVSFCQYIVTTLPAVKLVVSTMQPAGAEGSASETEVEQYNSLILNDIKSVSANVSTVDSFSGMTYAGSIGPDGVHPNVAGCQQIANAFGAGVKALYTGGTTGTSTPISANAPSASGYVVNTPGQTPMYDAVGNAYTVLAGSGTTLIIQENGVTDTTSVNPDQILYYNGLVWYQETSGWWHSTPAVAPPQWSGQVPDPRS